MSGYVPGIYPDMPEDQYHADLCVRPSLNSTTARVIVERSCAHARLQHPRFGGTPKRVTKEMDEGKLTHAILEGRNIDEIVAVLDYQNYKTHAAQDERDAARQEGLTPILRHRYDDLLATANHMKAQLDGFGLKLGEHREVSMVWEDRNGVLCRLRLDNFNDEANIVYDYKTTRNAHPKKCRRQISTMNYHVQDRHYVDGVATAADRETPRFIMLFMETEPPYCITPMELSESNKTLGSVLLAGARDQWRRALESDDFPGYTSEIIKAEASPWELEEAMVDETGEDRYG